ncbi:MAG: methionine adenosyltransferase [Bacteroidales bacterium]|nr:methionine adenosyltransferase [Lentimicrobiaceae bacterium]MDD5695139.1 methionine adenosyltransferase [Bacteroidales bacterium]
MAFLFTSESVSEGHPDKIADQISDALLDEFLRHDPESKVACETLVTTGLVICAGEVLTDCWVDVQRVVRDTIRSIGYTKAEYKFDADSCGVITTIHEQSQDITRGVVKQDVHKYDQGAGDQGMMFGMATREMDNLMPMPIELAHIFVQQLARIRKETHLMPYLRPDSKSQVTIEYDDHGQPGRIHTILISTQHDDWIKPHHQNAKSIAEADKKMNEKITDDIRNILIPGILAGNDVPERVKKLFDDTYKLYVNPTGKFVIGGPHGDTGLTGRKIIVDTYGGKGYHGGGAFSGKDASKVDRSAAYAARHIAKNLVAAGIADEVHVQIAYAIGVPEPLSVNVSTMGTVRIRKRNGELWKDSEIAGVVTRLFDLRPRAIIERLGLTNPIFLPTATYGHFGRDPYKKEIEFIQGTNRYRKEVEFFTWEKLDYVDEIKSAFNA